ncbi:MAG TPA: hypothetical protein VEL47_00760 [Myxococcota bacterium]|nr:hypothetical protein [Myxococcota bacterium]
MKTMLIGSFRLATIPVRSSWTVILQCVGVLLLTEACDPSSNLKAIGESQIDYNCQNKCEQHDFTTFSGKAVHLEIEPIGEIAQVFYYVDTKNLKTTPITLRNVIKVKGRAPGAESLILANLEPNFEGGDFTDIIALPMINNTDFLTPRLQTRKAHLTSAGYQIELLSELSYTLILNPGGFGSRAPIHVNPGVLTSNQNLNFLVDAATVKGRGRVISDNPDLFARSDLPIMRVRLMQGPRLASSVAEIDHSGSFSLSVTKPLFHDLAEQPLNLVIEPIDTESALPRIKQKLSYETVQRDFDLGVISLGDLKKPLSTTIDIRGSNKSIIGHAYLYLSARVGQGSNLIKKQVAASGTAEIHELFDGRYNIAVLPPFDSPFAMRLLRDVEFEAGKDSKLSITLDRRKELSATVTGPRGQAIGGAQIELLRIGEIGNLASEDIYDDMLFKLTAVTSEDGRVCHRRFGFSTSDNDRCDNLLLDEGRYLAHIIPPAGTELAHLWLTFDFPEIQELALVLEQPDVLVGQIVASDQTPIKSAFVTVYLAESNPHNQAKMIGNAVTDDRGFFRAFVSSH